MLATDLPAFNTLASEERVPAVSVPAARPYAWPRTQRRSATLRAGAPSLVGRDIGPFRLTRALGEGGMGVVYLAEQRVPLVRQVALKVIKLGLDSHEIAARFEAERQSLALMNHPGIAQVLDAGRDGRRAGRTSSWSTWRADADALLRRAASRQHAPGSSCSCSVCEAVQHAHQKGVIHRDLKPSNILVATATGGRSRRSSTSAWPR